MGLWLLCLVVVVEWVALVVGGFAWDLASFLMALLSLATSFTCDEETASLQKFYKYKTKYYILI